MGLFRPDFYFGRLTDLTTEFLRNQRVTALFLDADNTLTEDNSQEIRDDVRAWLRRQRKAGFRLFIFSNNRRERVRPLADRLGLDFVAEAGKPGTRILRAELEKRHLDPDGVLVVGDQVFTDVLCGKRAGCRTVLVEPFAPEHYGWYRLKRPLERLVLSRFFRTRGKDAAP